MSTLHSLAARQHRFLVVLFNFPEGVPRNEKFDPLFDEHAGDWLRFNAYTWLVWTDKTVEEWYEILRHHITQADQVLIGPIDLKERAGWSQKWVWDWIDRAR
jgi:hypothetical protein